MNPVRHEAQADQTKSCQKIPQILGGKVNFPLCLAPMVGLSHVALRLVLRDYLPANAKTIWPTEMLNSRKIPKEVMGETPESKKGEFEEGLVPQILGNEENYIADSVASLEKWGAEGIDINMGCPVQKALRHNYGVALMGDAAYAADVVRMTVKNTRLPVSVKLRAMEATAGGEDFLFQFVSGLQQAGASWITLHPRTASQKRRGRADWEQIRKLKRQISLPVIGNGDIQTLDDVDSMLSSTGCDMVMAGRALAAKPWMLWQLGEKMGFLPPTSDLICGREAPKTPLEEGAEYGRSLRRLIRYLKQYFNEDFAIRRLRFHVRTTAVWLDFGHTLFSLVSKTKTLDEMDLAIEEFFRQPLQMVARTDLRE